MWTGFEDASWHIVVSHARWKCDWSRTGTGERCRIAPPIDETHGSRKVTIAAQHHDPGRLHRRYGSAGRGLRRLGIRRSALQYWLRIRRLPGQETPRRIPGVDQELGRRRPPRP